eukprot:m.181204 g.181204  ORF g.181204 m.181204 type:complete len:517 (+) comp18444_c0_seq1:99-1649(+)
MGTQLVLLAALGASLLAVMALADTKSAGFKLSDLKKPVVVTADNFDQLVEAEIPVLLVVSKADTFEGDKELAKELEALARVGVLNKESQKDLIASKKLDVDNAQFFVKAFGKDTFAPHESLESGKEAATASNPQRVITISDGKEIEPFLGGAIAETRLPIFLFHDKEEVPPVLAKVSLWMHDHFVFAHVPKPTEALLTGLGLPADVTPALLAMIPQLDKQATPQGGIGFQGAQYNREHFGPMKFKNLMKWLGQVRMEMTKSGFYDRKVEKDTPKADQPAKAASVKSVPLFEYTADTPDACAEGKLGLCVFGILDGSPLNDAKEQQLEVLREVQNKPANKGRVLHFMWVDLTCHPTFGEAFDVTMDNVPTVVAVTPKKGAYAKLFGAFESSKIGGFIGGVLSGKNRITAFPEGTTTAPVISAEVNCTAVHESMMPIETDDLDMDDIMSEMAAEAEQEKEAQEKAFAELEDQAADVEMEEKRRKAAAEAAKMNKISNKKRSKKNKKKKKKSKKSKEEL